MANAIDIRVPDARPPLPEAIERVVMMGDLRPLNSEQRVSYYRAVCESVGLNPLTKPFDYLDLNGKLVLYANRACADQLRNIHQISITITDRRREGDVYIVTARATKPDGRVDEATGVVSIGKAGGDALANAYMKAETKAKRRVTLSICGLSVLDELEVDSTPGAKRVSEADLTKLETINTKLAAQPDTTPEKQVVEVEPGYVIPFGKFNGKLITDVPAAELNAYCSALIEDFAKNKKPIGGKVREFFDRVEALNKGGAQ